MLKYAVIVIMFIIFTLLIWLNPGVTVNDISATKPLTSFNASSVSKRVNAANKMNNELPESLENSSLKGTTIDGLYPVDDDGNLLLSEDIKHRFEYFLSTMGEFSVEQVQQMIRDDIELNLVEPARSQALQLFKDYVGYKYALADLEQSLQAAQDYEIHDIERMRYQLQQLRDKRREYFDQETVDAFFGFDEVYDDFMLNRLEIQANSQLTAKEKTEQIEALEQTLPSEVREMREETQKVSDVFKLAEEMRAQGVSEDDIFEMNAQEFGQEAALRLQEVDAQRQAWQSKVSHYLAQKQVINADETLTDSEKLNQINSMLEQFDKNERPRLKAYELMQREQDETE